MRISNVEEHVTFNSQGFKLSGILHVPDDLKAGERRPACLVLHGFGSNKGSKACISPAKLLEKWGYVALRFDMRGCGESEGPRAHIICLEQVEDTKSAVTYLMSRPEVDPGQDRMRGPQLRCGVAVYTGGVDQRIAAVISSGGWGDGQTQVRASNTPSREHGSGSPKPWSGRAAACEDRESIKISRYDIVPIPEGMRGNLAPGSIMEFPFETVESMLAFRANDVVGKDRAAAAVAAARLDGIR